MLYYTQYDNLFGCWCEIATIENLMKDIFGLSVPLENQIKILPKFLFHICSTDLLIHLLRTKTFFSAL